MQGSGGDSFMFTPTRPPRPLSLQLRVVDHVTMSSESHNVSDGTVTGSESEVTKMSKFGGPGVV